MPAPSPADVNAAYQSGAITYQEAQTLLGGQAPTPSADAINKALSSGAITQDEAHTLLNPPTPLDKLAGVVSDAGSGLLNTAVQTGHALGDVAAGVAGIPGELQRLGDKVLPSWMNYHEPGAPLLPTPQDIENTASSATGITFPAPQTTYQKFVYKGAKGGFSMLSPEKWPALLGIVSGLAGQEADTAGHPELSTLAQAVPLAAGALGSLVKPWDVSALGPWVERIGSDAITRAGSAAQEAANVLKTATTSIGNQEPALKPLMDWLEQQPTGAPISALNQGVEAAAKDALANGTFPAAGTRVWNPDTGWQDASTVASNAVVPPVTTPPFPGITSDITSSSTKGVLPTILNLIPGRGGSMLSEALGGALSKARLGALTDTMASPGAADYLTGLGDYSKTNAVIGAIAQALASLGIQNSTSGPASIPSPF